MRLSAGLGHAVHLIVGLGNPGAKYAGNRHNVGFMVLDALRDARALGPYRDKFKGEFLKAHIGGAEVVLLKPQTYMNVSGESVRPAMQFFKVELASVLVVHDELDLPFESQRLKVGGGTAGHNGLKSIQGHCGGPGFARLRIGIGRPRSGSVHSHVLGDFSSEERIALPDVLQRASAAIEDVLDRGVQAAMNHHNR